MEYIKRFMALGHSLFRIYETLLNLAHQLQIAYNAYCPWLFTNMRIERRIKENLIESFKIIDEMSNYGRHLFNIPLIFLDIYCQDRFQKLRLLINLILFFFANRVI